MDSALQQEIKRIRSEYKRRDDAGISRLYQYTNPAFQFHMQEREWAILHLLREEQIGLEGKTVLEIGCGTGHILQRFLEFGVCKTVGIDLMDSRIQVGKRTYPQIHFVQGDGAQLPFEDDSFDIVTQFMCLSSVLDPFMRKQIADEMWRVLSPGGAILSYDLRPRPLATPLLFLPFSIVHRILKMTVKDRDKLVTLREGELLTPVKPLSMDEIKRLFGKSPLRYRVISLDFNLSRIARKSFFLAHLLSCIVLLRTHYLVLFRKMDRVMS